MSQPEQSGKEESVQVGKEEVKSSSFARDVSLCIGDPTDFTGNLLELTNRFSKTARRKVNMQKSVVFLYTNNKSSEQDPKKTVPFTTA